MRSPDASRLPPVLTGAAPSRLSPDRAAPSSLLIVASAFLAACLAALGLPPMPPCAFKLLTGMPCAFCGSTRAALALAQLDFAAALRFNPLTTLALLGAFAWGLVWGAGRFLTRHRAAHGSGGFGASRRAFGMRWAERVTARLGRRAWLVLGVAVLLANWAYLLVTGR